MGDSGGSWPGEVAWSVKVSRHKHEDLGPYSQNPHKKPGAGR